MVFCYARPHPLADLDQTWYGGSLHPWAQLRVGGQTWGWTPGDGAPNGEPPFLQCDSTFVGYNNVRLWLGTPPLDPLEQEHHLGTGMSLQNKNTFLEWEYFFLQIRNISLEWEHLSRK